MPCDFNDLKRIPDLGKTWDVIAMFWNGFSIWKGLGECFQRFGKDSRFGKDLGCDFNDLERVLDLEMIWDGIFRFWKGFSIWKGFGV